MCSFYFLPWASKNSTVPRCPSEAAIIRGVRPCLSARLTSAPCVRSRSTIWKHPNTAHIWIYNWKSHSLMKGMMEERNIPKLHCLFEKENVALMNSNQNRNIQLTCQCPCRTALNSGTMPLLLGWATAAPCSSNRRHTSSFPRPDAAVRAGQKHTMYQWRDEDEFYIQHIIPVNMLSIIRRVCVHLLNAAWRQSNDRSLSALLSIFTSSWGKYLSL